MPDATKRPNLIWVFGDQMRGQAMGCAGDPNATTPNLDLLAASGVRFSGAVAGFPLCCPFRGSLLTSRYPHECVPGHEYPMPPEMPTVAHAFRDAGYHTAYFGKWHLDGWHERDGRAGLHIVPPQRRGGFHQWTGFENNNSQWDCWVHGGGSETDPREPFQYRLPGYETDELTDLLIDYIENRAGPMAGGAAEQAEEPEPFFAVLSVQPPHDPYTAPPEFMANYNPARLRLRPNVPPVPRIQETARRDLAGAYAQIENLDWNLGRLRDALLRTGQAENTWIVFFSDHGDMHGSHGQLRKTSPWQESISIPFIVAGALPSRYDTRFFPRDGMVNHVDIAPTSLGLCGIDVPDWMRGHDYAPTIVRNPVKPPEGQPDSAYLQSVIPTGHGNSIDRPWRGLTTRDGWKYVCLEGQPWMLYNLNEDPYELANHAHNTAYAAERKRLQDRLAQWVNDTGDAFELPEL